MYGIKINSLLLVFNIKFNNIWYTILTKLLKYKITVFVGTFISGDAWLDGVVRKVGNVAKKVGKAAADAAAASERDAMHLTDVREAADSSYRRPSQQANTGALVFVLKFIISWTDCATFNRLRPGVTHTSHIEEFWFCQMGGIRCPNTYERRILEAVAE